MFHNRHRGQRCFVIASGPSINRMDLSWLKDEVTLCVNQSYRALDFEPTYVCIGDRELWPRIKNTYARMASTVICTTGLNGQVGSDYHGDNLGLVVPLERRIKVSDGHFRHDLEAVYAAYNVIGETVLPFVLAAGFDECYLIGCDCTDEGYFYDAAESARPDYPQRVFPEALAAYRVIANYARTRGLTRIVNATYGGRLDAFDRVLFDSLEPGAPPAPLVVGYYTPHAKYRALARNMASTVRDFGLEVEIHERPDLAAVDRPSMMNWALNCAQCGPFIRDMMDAHPGRDLIYLDADAEMRKRPALYLDPDSHRDGFDFAAPFLSNGKVANELQSNSLYFAATPAARRLVDAWCAEQARRNARLLDRQYSHPYHEAWDQWVLQNVLDELTGEPAPLRVKRLPMTYGKIMPTPQGIEITPDVPLDEAVITQHQASREMRHKQVGRDLTGAVRERLEAERWAFPSDTEEWAARQLTGQSMALDEQFETLSAAEFAAYAADLGRPARVLDLACGLGRVSIYLNRRLNDPGVHYILADSNGACQPRYGWNAQDEFYNSLPATEAFCRANGLDRFETFDVREDAWQALVGWPDVIISMLGIGFHVPLENEIDRIHALAREDTVCIFGVGGSADFPEWERDHDFTRWFREQAVVPFTSAYPTHEGRILILKGRREFAETLKPAEAMP